MHGRQNFGFGLLKTCQLLSDKKITPPYNSVINKYVSALLLTSSLGSVITLGIRDTYSMTQSAVDVFGPSP